MRHDDYEDRKRRIEEHYQAGVELLEAGRRLQLRTLDLLWMSEGETMSLGGAPGVEPSASDAPKPISAAPPKPKRRPAYQVYDDVVAALASVPEEFTRDEILQVLDYEPDRSALHRILMRLVEEDRRLIVIERGSGRLPSVYKKAVAEAARSTE